VTDEMTGMDEIAGPNKADVDDVAAISRKRTSKRKTAEHEKAITELGKSKISTTVEYHREKPG
jgi:hypothetical protein